MSALVRCVYKRIYTGWVGRQVWAGRSDNLCMIQQGTWLQRDLGVMPASAPFHQAYILYEATSGNASFSQRPTEPLSHRKHRGCFPVLPTSVPRLFLTTSVRPCSAQLVWPQPPDWYRTAMGSDLLHQSKVVGSGLCCKEALSSSPIGWALGKASAHLPLAGQASSWL
jgi:hypothetical protein